MKYQNLRKLIGCHRNNPIQSRMQLITVFVEGISVYSIKYFWFESMIVSIFHYSHLICKILSMYDNKVR